MGLCSQHLGIGQRREPAYLLRANLFECVLAAPEKNAQNAQNAQPLTANCGSMNRRERGCRTRELCKSDSLWTLAYALCALHARL